MRVLEDAPIGCGSPSCRVTFKLEHECLDCGYVGRLHARSLCKPCYGRRCKKKTLDEAPTRDLLILLKVPAERFIARSCNRCGQVRMANEFYRHKKAPGGRTSVCKACTRRRVQENWDHYKDYRGQWQKDNRDRTHAYQMKLDYGIPLGEYTEMLAAQGGVCAVCEQPETVRNNAGNVRKLSVDHDHATGRVRGLLCNGCNTALGTAKDDPALLRALAEYLERS